MEHHLPAPNIRPWRTATLVASAVAAVELVILLAVGALALAEPVSERVQQAAEQQVFAPVRQAPAAKPDEGEPRLTRAQTSVLVLNGNGVAGAAAAQAAAVKARGYVVGGVGNAPRLDHTRSLVMYRPGYRPEAERLARDLRLKIVGPLDGLTKKDLLGAHVAVVVGE